MIRNLIFKLAVKYLFLKNGSQTMVVYNDWIGFNIMLRGFYESKKLKALKKNFNININDSIYLDIGANIGNHAVFFRNTFKKIICFEPQKRTFELLKLNTLRYSNIELYNYGIDVQKREVKFKIPYKNTGMTTEHDIHYHDYYEENVLMRPFDINLNESVGFIKIDVEGMEYQVLNSLKKLISLNKPIIAFELNINEKHTEHIFNLFKSLDYNCFYTITKREMLKKIDIEALLMGNTNQSMIIAVNERSDFKFN